MNNILLINLVCVLTILTEPLFSMTFIKQPFPENVEHKVQPFYKNRPDGKPGREVMLIFSDAKLSAGSELEIIHGDTREIIPLKTGTEGADSVAFLLPPDIGVREDADVDLVLRQESNKLIRRIKVPALRHWTVFVYPHSHVDIGYSNTQENVEFIHRRNIDQGIALAEKTKGYPESARYIWNTEVMWPLERYLNSANPAERERMIDAVRQGQLCLDAAYVHVNTSTCSDEELFQLFRSRRDMVKLTGKPVDVMVQVDIPGMAWGVVPVMAQEGIKYIMMFPNGTRGNQEKTYALNEKPFWWVGPDGKSKVLFMQPGSYAVGLAKGLTTGRPWFGQLDTSKIPLVVKTDNPRENFLDKHLFTTLPELELKKHPYDLFVVTWAMWDNALQDADLPEAVKSWNEEFAYPRLVISGAHEIMEAFEKKYGDELPEVRGDYTEYWTDNMGVAARQTRMNRNAKERLLQAETVWSMLNRGKPAPRAEFDEAWRNIILGTEHTYASENQFDPVFFDAIWKVKKSYFREAEDRSITLLGQALAPLTDRSEGALGPVEGPSEGGVAVINTHSWNHGGIVMLKKVESQRGDRVIDDMGNEVRSQRLSTGELVFYAPDVPAFGSRHYRVVPGKCSLSNTCRFSENMLDNGMLQVKIDPKTGNVVSLVETASGLDFADSRKGLNTFWWQPAKGAGKAISDSVIDVILKEAGPLLVEVQILSHAPGCRSLIRKVRLVHGQPWCEFSNTVDKLPILEKDGIHFGFGFNVPGSRTHSDIPWGVMELEEDQWPAANRAWIATQHWVDISNNEKGVTWCPLDAPLFEKGSITANNTGSWDGKGDIWPSEISPDPTIYSWVMNNHWYTNTPPAQDGPVTFRYSVLPHGKYDAVSANRFGLEQSQPLVHVLTKNDPAVRPLVGIDNDKVVVTILKSLGDGNETLIRLRSFSDDQERVNLKFPAGTAGSVFTCDVGEEPGSSVNGEVNILPYGMKTLLVRF